MIYSMTGYGKAENQVANNKKIVVEIRSLNSKSMDLSVRIAPQLRSKELDIRTLIAQRLERGKIDLSIYYQDATLGENTATFAPINREAFAYYYKELTALQNELGWANNQDIVSAILRMPDVTKVQDCGDVSDEEWAVVLQTIEAAIVQFNAFREQEGVSLYQMFCEKLDAIAGLLAEVEPYEQSRVEKIKARIEANLEQLSATTQQAIDRNRLEQEMIFYLEKLDITEEKVRLTNHLKYFRETMGEPLQTTINNSTPTGVGKKLGFIAQEMGREINTLGSKSNQSEMQIIVVKMKDILEQIKEQVLNVL
ncbi:MAG: YicC family protein [Paludibacteraceae bacterium]|nr:YicC family protein [Paludibacteraceae bacterium]